MHQQLKPILHWLLISVIFSLSACSTTQTQPRVIERSPVKKPAPGPKNTTDTATEKDWRPDFYTVKKGDTLYAIGLEFGYDYKEIAIANNINAPYPIKVGQQLNLKNLKQRDSKPIKETSADNGVVITPLKTEPNTNKATLSSDSPISDEPQLITEPKAIREPYSDQAFAAAPAKVTQQKTIKATPIEKTEIAKTEANKTETKPDLKPEAKQEQKSTSDDSIEWAWPTNGKVVTGFDDSKNAKGIDIAGSQGQAIKAAAAGKVIYSGSDLRGYGKLVIIKHSNNFLSVYAHNNQILVKEGQQVTIGQKIAEMGSTDADRVKLHFEIRKQGKSVDPTKYLAETAK